MAAEKKYIRYWSLSDEEIFFLENRFGAQHYSRLNFVARGAKGVWVYGSQNKKIFDCLAAYSAANPGHLHPHIVEAVNYAFKCHVGGVISNVVFSDTRAVFVTAIAKMFPQLGPRFGGYGNKVLLKNGGVESVETARKLACYYGYAKKDIPDGEQEIIVFENNFHGRTGEAIAMSTTEKYQQGFGVRPRKFYPAAKFGNLDSVKELITPNTCAILVEPMQGEGGMHIPPQGFLKGLREIADEYNLLLIFDEIQVGLGRTGKDFCFEHEGVVPDAITIGKALSGGVIPVSAFVTNTKLMDLAFWPGRDGSTYGAYPLACVAGIAALEVFRRENLTKNSEIMGSILKKRIEEIASRSNKVKEVRGRGLFIGIEIEDGNAMAYCRRLLDLGLLANDSHGHTIRISPPLIITMEHIDYICERLERVLVG